MLKIRDVAGTWSKSGRLQGGGCMFQGVGEIFKEGKSASWLSGLQGGGKRGLDRFLDREKCLGGKSRGCQRFLSRWGCHLHS